MFKEIDDNISTGRDLIKTINNPNNESVTSVEEDLRILDRILDDIENLDEDEYVDTMIDCNNRNNNNNNTDHKNSKKKKNNDDADRTEEVKTLVVERGKKLTTSEKVKHFKMIFLYMYRMYKNI